MFHRVAVLVAAVVVLRSYAAAAAETGKITLEMRDKDIHGVAVLVDGRLFADYVVGNGPKPYVWPIVGPTGGEMTRAYPMKRVDGEKVDHPHQRSMWFTYGIVDGVDFWSEAPGDGSPIADPKPGHPSFSGHGTILHRAYEKTAVENDAAVVVTRNDWLSPRREKMLEDRRRLTFRDRGDVRTIDFEITLRATERDVHFGETKEGAFGLRVPTEMDVDHKPHGGTIVDDEGRTDKDTWGRRAAWVDYSGTVGGEPVGIAVMNHPSSFRYPTRWHVRTYGLFAANPFGATSFDPESTDESGHTLRHGRSVTLRYRVILHRGDHRRGLIAEEFERYAAERPTEL